MVLRRMRRYNLKTVAGCSDRQVKLPRRSSGVVTRQAVCERDFASFVRGCGLMALLKADFLRTSYRSLAA